MRESIGWLLAAVGLILIGFVLALALNRSVLEAIALSIPSAVVFRTGMGLVRLATAARIAEASQPGAPGRTDLRR